MIVKHDTKIFLDGFKFTEGVRWYNNHLWFCDLWARKIWLILFMQ